MSASGVVVCVKKEGGEGMGNENERGGEAKQKRLKDSTAGTQILTIELKGGHGIGSWGCPRAA